MQRSTIGAVLRSNQAFYEQITERETLRYGIAFYSVAFAALPEANQFREVVIQAPGEIPAAFEAAEAFYAQQNLTCRRWAPADGSRIPGLAEFLADRGFVERVCDAMTLAEWVEIEKSADVRVLPARALRTAFRATFNDPSPKRKRGTFQPSPDREGGLPASSRADAYQERLDDPHMDMLVATVGDQPAGRCGLYQVGDIGRVIDLHVLGGFEGRGVGRSLLAHAIALAKRLALPVICTQVPQSDADSRRFYENAGFQVDGSIVEYERPQDPPPP